MNGSSDEQYRRGMARRKQHMDRRIVEASEDRGVLLVLTGPGKGKSSSAFGMVSRAVGYGMRTAIVYFIKSRETGELKLFRRLPEVEVHLMGEGFTWETQDRHRDRVAAERAWAIARRFLRDPAIRLVVLDELNVALRRGMLELEVVLEGLRARPREQHVVVTGRGAPEPLIELADTVSDIRSVKHAFQAGIKAQKGIEL